MHYPLQEIYYQNTLLQKETPKTIVPTQNTVAIVIHVFYSDIWHEEIKPYLDKVKIPYDLYLTIPSSMEEDEIIGICKSVPNATLYLVQNRGRDVLPFLQVLDTIGSDTYKYLCKLHTKKSAGRELGNVWRKLLYFDLLGSNGTVSDILDIFEEDEHTAMITGKNTILDSEKYYLGNREKTDRLLKLLNFELKEPYQFAGGTMFWVRATLVKPLLKLYREGLLVFESEQGQMDNTLAHAIERFFGILCTVQYKEIMGSPAQYKNLTEKTLQQVAALVLSQTYADKDIFALQKQDLMDKDALIKMKTEEIIEAHEGMYQRDQEIHKAHQELHLLHQELQESHLQLNEKNNYISYLESLTLKRRFLNKIKSVVPDKILLFLGFTPIHNS